VLTSRIFVLVKPYATFFANRQLLHFADSAALMLPDAYKVVVEPAHAFDDLVTSCKAATKWSVTEYNKTLNQIYQGQMRYFC